MIRSTRIKAYNKSELKELKVNLTKIVEDWCENHKNYSYRILSCNKKLEISLIIEKN